LPILILVIRVVIVPATLLPQAHNDKRRGHADQDDTRQAAKPDQQVVRFPRG